MPDTNSTTSQQQSDFLVEERKRLEERKKTDKTLFVRNILNSIFIIMAIAAMVGVLISKPGTTALYISYGVGITAILFKMAEVMIRMPSMMRKTEYEKRKETKQ